MRAALLKLFALAAVVAVGVLVVVQAQKGLLGKKNDPSAETDSTKLVDLGEPSSSLDESGDGLPGQSEPSMGPEGFSDDTEIVSAAAKTSSGSARRTRPASALDEDPFGSDDLSIGDKSTTARSTSTSAGSSKKSSKLSLDIVDLDSDDSLESGTKSSAVKPKSAASTRGPLLSKVEPDDETEMTDVETPHNKRPRLLATGEPSTPKLKSTIEDDDDPFSAAEAPSEKKTPAARRASPLDEEEDELKPVPSASTGTKSKIAPRVPLAEDSDASDEPLVERPATPRKSASPPVGRISESATEEDDADFAAGVKRKPSQFEESVPVAKPAVKSAQPSKPATLSADPFAEDEEPISRSKSKPTTSKPEKSRPTLTLEDEPEPELSAVPEKKQPSLKRNADSTLEEDDADFGNLAKPGSKPASTRTRPDLEIPEKAPTLESDDADFGNRSSGTPALPSAPVERSVPRGAQRPQVTIEKIAPSSAALGQPMIYQIVVRNVGPVPAQQVTVEDVVPQNVRIDGSNPQAELDGRKLLWKLGTLEPNRERKIAVKVTPQSEGTIGSVATVNFATAGGMPANSTAPRLKFDVSAPRQVTVGSPVLVSFRVSNVGRVDATGVTIREVLPAALRHPDGDDLEYEIGTLPAGKMKEVQLELTAAQAGRTVNRAVVTADGNLTEEAVVQLEVVGATLNVSRTGPKRLYPNKTGSYTNTVMNPDTTAISNVKIVETVPAGMEFVDASDGGQYNAAKRSVTWTVDRLRGGESKSVRISLTSASRGAQVSVVRASDSSGASGETVATTNVAGVPGLTIKIDDFSALVEPGEQVKIPVRIVNRGNDVATNVKATILIPAGMQLVDARGPTDYKAVSDVLPQNVPAGQRIGNTPRRPGVVFSPLNRLDPGADASFEITLQARTPGNARLQVEAQCDQVPEPIRREDHLTVASQE